MKAIFFIFPSDIRFFHLTPFSSKRWHLRDSIISTDVYNSPGTKCDVSETEELLRGISFIRKDVDQTDNNMKNRAESIAVKGALRRFNVINRYTYMPEPLRGIVAIMILKACIFLGSMVPCQLLSRTVD